MKVITADGPRPIKDLKVGDRVLTMDEGGRQGYNPVLKTYKDKNNHYYLINGKIKVTALHRFATADGWKKARELKVGDRIRTAEGTLEAVVSTELVAADLKVYNLTVAENHNFFVAPDGATGYLVHNTGGGGGK
jgi:intein/homing endonuclease